MEFRRKSPRRPVNHLFVYATAPVKQVVGYARVTCVVEGSLESIWSQYGSVGGITKAEFDDYFTGLSEGSAIVLSDATLLKVPVSAASVILDSNPPQSFMYVSTDVVRTLACG